MTRLLWLTPLLLALLLAACPSDDDDSAPPIVDDLLTVRGEVFDLGGSPVVGATVLAAEAEVLTDSAGAFALPPRDAAGQLAIAVLAEGFTTGVVVVDLDSMAPWARVVLAELDGGTIDDVDAGGEVAGDDGTAIQFDAGGSFLDPDGEPVSGAVDVGFVVLNTAAEMSAAPPMELADGTPLESYGVFEVQLTQDGVPLTFEGQASVRIPLATQLQLPDGQQVDLYSFDEAAAAWTSEGTATVHGGFVVADLGHFSTWTPGLPLEENGCVTGTLLLEDGSPAAGAVVYATGVDYLGVNDTTAAADGSFCLEVKVDSLSHLVGFWVDPVTGDVFTKEGDVTTDATPHECATGGCEDVGEQTMTDGVSDEDGDGYSDEEGDCDDADPGVHPAADDLPGDGVDSNCDGIDGIDEDADGYDQSLDCDDTNPDAWPGAPTDTWVDGVDQDCDGFDGPDADGDGYADAAAGGDDCDDGNSSVQPGAAEACDWLDTDCDGSLPADEADADGDGFMPCDGDCEDGNPGINPGADEHCNGIDDQCNGAVPADEVDGDGDGDPPCNGDCDDTDPSLNSLDSDGDNQSTCNGDCDDANPDVFNSAVEICDGQDGNCDGTIPSDETDGDSDGEMPCEGDCDDAEVSVNSSATEVCDGYDTDCDGTLPPDENDGDADNFMGCTGDCDDTNDTVHPGAPELCDATDNNCDTVVDEGVPYTTWYFDGDGDGWGGTTGAPPETTCDGPPAATNWVDQGGDCNDAFNATFPGNPEVCDTIDNNCDGVIDEGC